MENEQNWFKWSYKLSVKLSVKDYTGWDFSIWPKKIFGRFAGTKRSGRIDEVKVTRGSTVTFGKKNKNRTDLSTLAQIQDIDSIISKHIHDHTNEWSKDKILHVFWVVWRILRL